ncbi:MAG TPA: tripartite tricarboxylate transporter substrate-binding protein [Xanthobacteraceae bacterium]|jgi:tripartite-type tricarboxylate transporter receptor subunit TctC|nr:tripartite tricarboxylate transporter substrate-binding protein [Xanthobacteraceae bacterium]
MKRRSILGALLAVALAGNAHGQAWPTKQAIRLISPFPPGSAVDAVARPVFDNVSRQIGQSIVFESRAGAGGTIGMAAVAKAEPDGYTLLVNSSVHTITPSTYSKLPYDTVRDFAAIIPLAQFPNVLVVPPPRFKTIQELVAAGKAKPGSLTYGSGGVGAATHLNAERFRLSAGFEAVHVPFKGAPEALREILGNRIDFYFAPILSAVPLIESNEVRGLAVSGLTRSDVLPDIPTTLEAGYPNSDYVFWIGLFAPAATPRDIVVRLHDAAAKALADKAVADNLRKLGAAPMTMTPAAFDAYVKAEIATIATVVKAAGIQPN